MFVNRLDLHVGHACLLVGLCPFYKVFVVVELCSDVVGAVEGAFVRVYRGCAGWWWECAVVGGMCLLGCKP